MATFTGDGRLQGPLTMNEITRAQHAQEDLASYFIPWGNWRVWDAFQTVLPGTSATDDLGLYGGTFATASPSIRTYDVKTLTTTLYARTTLWLPPEYVAGETVTLRFHAGMITTVAGTSCTIDAQCYESDKESGIGADLVTTAAQSINSLTLADKDFTVTPTTLSPGDILDLRIAISVVDAATGTAVISTVGFAALLCDIRG